MTSCYSSGFIFVSTKDFIGKITSVIHSVPFSAVGLYYPSTVTGTRKTIVCLLDLFGAQRSFWFKKDTLDELLKNPNVESIHITPLKYISETGEILSEDKIELIHRTFRTAALNRFCHVEQRPLNAILLEFFDLKKESRVMRMLNDVVLSICSVAEYSGTYTYENCPLIDSSVSIDLKNAGIKSDPMVTEHVRSVVNTWIDRMSNNVQFFDMVMSLFPKDNSDLTLFDALWNCINTSLSSSVLSKKRLEEVLIRAKRRNPTLKCKIKCDMNLIPIESGGKTECFEQLHSLTKDIVSSIENGETPVINIRKLIDITNKISCLEHIDSVSGSGSHTAILITDSSDRELNCILKTGTHVILPTSGADLSNLTREELKELVVLLEEECHNDQRFGSLFNEAVRRLNFLCSN